MRCSGGAEQGSALPTEEVPPYEQFHKKLTNFVFVLRNCQICLVHSQCGLYGPLFTKQMTDIRQGLLMAQQGLEKNSGGKDSVQEALDHQAGLRAMSEEANRSNQAQVDSRQSNRQEMAAITGSDFQITDQSNGGKPC